MNLTHEDQVFAGFIDPHIQEDGYSYLAKMRQGAEGARRYESRFTSEPHRPLPIFIFYLALGRLAGFMGLSSLALFHAARIASSALLLFAIDRLTLAFGLRGPSRPLVFLLASAGGGVGWLVARIAPGSEPLGRLQVEATTFSTMASFPHLALASALVVGSLAALLRFARGESRASLAWIALFAFALAWVHPQLVASFAAVGAAMSAFAFARDRPCLRRAGVGLGAALLAASGPMLLAWFSVRADPAWSAWAKTSTNAAGPLEYLEGFGLLWPLAAGGAVVGLRRREPWARPLVAWLVVASALPYLPIASQRRFAQGWILPLAILSGGFIGEALPPRLRAALGERGARVCVAALILFLCLSSFDCVVYGAKRVLRPLFPTYYSQPRADAMKWLDENAGADDVILCSRLSGRFIPALTGARVVLGHWAETFDRESVEREVERFFAAETSDAERRDFLDRRRVRFLFYTPFEAALGGYDPGADAALWSVVGESRSIVLYERADR
jgi:hypothetical protein